MSAPPVAGRGPGGKTSQKTSGLCVSALRKHNKEICYWTASNTQNSSPLKRDMLLARLQVFSRQTKKRPLREISSKNRVQYFKALTPELLDNGFDMVQPNL